MGWSGRAPASQARKLRGSQLRQEPVPCHGSPRLLRSPPSASIWARTASISSAQDERGAIVLRIKLSRAQLTRRLANLPPCLIGIMDACAGAHYIGRQLQALGHDVRLIPAQYVKPFLKGHKND